MSVRRHTGVGVAAVLASALLAMPQVALAHSNLTAASPASGATVDAPPDEVVLTFSDPVTVPDGLIEVLDLHGRNLAPERVEVEGRTVTIQLDDDGTGTRVVSWTILSDHSTPVTGTFEYHVGEVTPGADTEPGAMGEGARRAEATDGLRAITGTALLLASVACVAAFAIRRRRGTTGGWTSLVLGFGAVAVVAGAAGAIAASDQDVRVTLALGAVAAGLALVLATRAASIATILASLVLLVGVGSVLAAAPEPPEAQRFEQEVTFGKETSAVVTMDPTVAGLTDVDVVVSNADGTPDEDVVEANLRYQPADESMGNFQTTLENQGGGRFIATDVLVPFPGPWKFELTVAEDRFSAALASFETSFAANPEVE